jgi:hypothetical protein
VNMLSTRPKDSDSNWTNVWVIIIFVGFPVGGSK